MPVPLHEAETRAREIGRGIHEMMPEGWGFVLVMAEIGSGEGCTYIADVAREDAAKLMVETARIIQEQEQDEALGPGVN